MMGKSLFSQFADKETALGRPSFLYMDIRLGKGSVVLNQD